MDNRRECYRVSLSEAESISARITLGNEQTLSAKIISLSLSGIGVTLDQPSPALAMHQRLRIEFKLPKAILSLSFSMQVRRPGSAAPGSMIGLQFVPSGDPKEDEEREKKIWPYLLERQNREIRGLRKPPRPR